MSSVESIFEKDSINNDSINNDSIFIKQSEIPKKEQKLCYQSIIDSLPEPHYKESKSQLRSKAIEWRWRFYKIGDIKVAEMSFLPPSSNERTYVDKNGNYVKKNIGTDFDKYIIEEYYFYTMP